MLALLQGMNAVGNSNPLVSAAPRTAAAKARGAQKPNPASGLQTGMGGYEHSGQLLFQEQRKSDASQLGTVRDVPFRYGPEAPRLTAAFVAQLLGQIMPDTEQQPSGALAAYEEPGMSALLCDRHL
jgi:hypothetical protein